MPETLEGYISNIIFRNEENGYTVLELVSGDKEITCVGNFESLHAGETVELYGKYTEHPSYGSQFRAERYEIRIPRDAAAIERYLASGAVKGIGETLAHRIVRAFGDSTLRIMQEEPERLAEIKGISERMAREIGSQIEEQSEMREAMMFLQEYGISLAVGIRIFREYGSKMYPILKENPYQLAEDIDGIGFKTADEIAARIGIRADAAYRIRSAVLYVLMQTAQEGSIYLPERELLSRTAELLALDEDLIETEIGNLAADRKIIPDRGEDGALHIYHARYYYLETETARMLCDLNRICSEDEREAEERIRSLTERSPITLEEEQLEAIRFAAKYGITIITGGPGTGKTTVVNEILRYFESIGSDVLLAAPTGRAARRMTETTGYEASTIHRLLEIGAIGNGDDTAFQFARNAMNPLEADVIMIDEMSMVDISLMNALLKAVVPGTRMVFVGDVDQLPSVGPGRVLRDMIDAEVFPTVRLTRIFRQEETSDIVINAHRINQGEPPVLNNKSRDFFFLERSDANRIISNMITLIKDKLPSYVDASPFDIQVLTPMRKGMLGVDRLNRILQEYLNPPSTKKAEKEFGEGLFREGDKVMQIKNDYQLAWEVRGKYGIPVFQGTGVFNGDMGVVAEIDSGSNTVTVTFDEGRTAEYTTEQLNELELAYAVTIHKSQGSEYPAVLLPLLGGPQMLLTRNLLYTAVTRARKCVVILGKQDVVTSMADNLTEQIRYTSLKERILEIHSLSGNAGAGR
ncbi:MAG: ATP-dependent RecD-like DNA helicase [Lachnospiraceae bacterium]|nr:ATP-dependent RecD-like DNA helicase [Lachnospiraceae bacterium]